MREIVLDSGRDFYIFSSDPAKSLSHDAAELVVKLVTLPPSPDRHKDWLTEVGIISQGHFSWTAWTQPFKDMEIVEVYPGPLPWPRKVRCYFCYNQSTHYQCAHSLQARWRAGDVVADPRPSVLALENVRGPGRPLKPAKQHARSSASCLSAADARARRAAEDRAVKRARIAENLLREPSPDGHVVALAPQPSPVERLPVGAVRVVPAASSEDPSAVPADPNSSSPRALDGPQPSPPKAGPPAATTPLAALPPLVGDRVEIWSESCNQWMPGRITRVLSPDEPHDVSHGMIIPPGSTQVTFAKGRKWILPRHRDVLMRAVRE